jgi:type I restriction enzyme, S subunit
MQWPKVKLDSVKADIRYAFVGGPFGSNLTTRDYVDEGVPVSR